MKDIIKLAAFIQFVDKKLVEKSQKHQPTLLYSNASINMILLCKWIVHFNLMRQITFHNLAVSFHTTEKNIFELPDILICATLKTILLRRFIF